MKNNCDSLGTNLCADCCVDPLGIAMDKKCPSMAVSSSRSAENAESPSTLLTPKHIGSTNDDSLEGDHDAGWADRVWRKWLLILIVLACSSLILNFCPRVAISDKTDGEATKSGNLYDIQVDLDPLIDEFDIVEASEFEDEDILNLQTLAKVPSLQWVWNLLALYVMVIAAADTKRLYEIVLQIIGALPVGLFYVILLCALLVPSNDAHHEESAYNDEQKLSRNQKRRLRKNKSKQSNDVVHNKNLPDPRIERKRNGQKRKQVVLALSICTGFFCEIFTSLLVSIAGLLYILYIVIVTIGSGCNASFSKITAMAFTCIESTHCRLIWWIFATCCQFLCMLARSYLSFIFGWACYIVVRPTFGANTVKLPTRCGRRFVPWIVAASPIIQCVLVRYYQVMDPILASVNSMISSWNPVITTMKALITRWVRNLLLGTIGISVSLLMIIYWLVPSLLSRVRKLLTAFCHPSTSALLLSPVGYVFSWLGTCTLWAIQSTMLLLCTSLSSMVTLSALSKSNVFFILALQYLAVAHASDDDENEEDGLYGFSFIGGDINEDQGSVYEAVLNACLRIAVMLFNSNQLFVPSMMGHFWKIGAFVTENLPMLGDSTCSKIYFLRNKVGSTWNGATRKAYYKNVTDPIYTIFNLDIQNKSNHSKLVQAVIALCKEFSKSIKPGSLKEMTIQEAINMEAHELPFFAILFLYSIGHCAEDCVDLGGGIAIGGFLRRVILLVVESGIQMLFQKLGINLADASMPHEWINGGLMKWVKESHERCVECGEAFFEELKEKFGTLDGSIDERVSDPNHSYIEYVLKNSIRMVALSSWAPDVKCLPLTEVLLNLIFSHWTDAFGKRNPVKRGFGDIYDAAGGFNGDDRNFAFGNFEDFLRYLQETLAAFGALDSNKEMLKSVLAGNKTMNEILLERGWKHFFSFNRFGLDIEVYYYQKKEGYWPSFLFLHGPPCHAFSTKESTLAQHLIESMQKRAVELHLLFLISREFLQGVMQNGFNVSRDLAQYTVMFNILMAHAMFAFLVSNFHLSTKGACLFAKNMMVAFNAFLMRAEGYHNGLFSHNCNNGIVSKRVRDGIYRECEEQREFHFGVEVVNVLTRCISDSVQSCIGIKMLSLDESMTKAAAILKVNDSRFTLFKAKNFVCSTLLKLITKAYMQEDEPGWELPSGMEWNEIAKCWELSKEFNGETISLGCYRYSIAGLRKAASVAGRFDAIYTDEFKARITEGNVEEMMRVIREHCELYEEIAIAMMQEVKPGWEFPSGLSWNKSNGSWSLQKGFNKEIRLGLGSYPNTIEGLQKAASAAGRFDAVCTKEFTATITEANVEEMMKVIAIAMMQEDEPGWKFPLGMEWNENAKCWELSKEFNGKTISLGCYRYSIAGLRKAASVAVRFDAIYTDEFKARITEGNVEEMMRVIREHCELYEEIAIAMMQEVEPGWKLPSGLSWHKGGQRWEFKKSVNGERLSLGCYPNTITGLRKAASVAVRFDAVYTEEFKATINEDNVEEKIMEIIRRCKLNVKPRAKKRKAGTIDNAEAKKIAIAMMQEHKPGWVLPSGLSWRKDNQCWFYKKSVNGKTIALGCYPNTIEGLQMAVLVAGRFVAIYNKEFKATINEDNVEDKRKEIQRRCMVKQGQDCASDLCEELNVKPPAKKKVKVAQHEEDGDE